MALVKGISAGFVTTAPIADPAGSIGPGIDTFAFALKDTTPGGDSLRVTEIGWYCDNATEAANFEVGLYTNNNTDDNPERLLGKAVAAKGTDAGWKKINNLNIPVSSGVTYWIAVQLDDTATTSSTNFNESASDKRDHLEAVTKLPDNWGASGGTSARLLAFYALVEIKSLATKGEKEIKTDWPHEEGLIAGTTKQTGRTMNLLPQGIHGIKSTIPENNRVGL